MKKTFNFEPTERGGGRFSRECVNLTLKSGLRRLGYVSHVVIPLLLSLAVFLVPFATTL